MSVWRRWTEDGAIRQEGVWGGGGALNTVVRDYHRRYACPIFITECSLNERAVEGSSFGVPPYPRGGPAGSRRVRWLDEAVETIANLRSEGLPVVGFCWWPLYDLVNWEYREGNAPVRRYLEPMGLFAIREAVDGTLRRERLPVAERMAEILAE
jgi:hypothetical protein